MRKTGWVLVAMMVLGLVLRLGVAFRTGLNEAPEPGSDQYEYDTYAWNVAQGRGYRGLSADVTDLDHLTAYRPPGASLVWAGLYRVFGHRYDVVRMSNCLAGAASILLVYGIGSRCFGETVGLLSAAVYAVWPLALYFPSQMLSETLATFWFLWFLLACLQFAERPTWWRAIGAGILLGVAILTRPNPLFMVPLVGLWALWQFRHNRSALIKGLAIPALAVLTLVPWWVRNYMVFHAFIPIATTSGSGLLQGNNRIVATDPEYYGYSIWDTRIPEYASALKSANDEIERDHRAKAFAIAWLKANPDRWLYLARAKIVRGWTPFLQPKSPRSHRLLVLATWGPALVLFLIALVPSLVGFLRMKHPGWLLHLAIVSSLIITLMFFGEIRYRYSIEPICLILAVEAAYFGVMWLRGRKPLGPVGFAAPGDQVAATVEG